MARPYIITHSGTRFHLDEFQEEDICLDDIAHSLTKTCRFGGSLPLSVHYSVAIHCTNLASYAMSNKEIAAVVLLHDASEAYLHDICSPLKHLLPDYKELENKLQSLIYEKYLPNVDIKSIINNVIELDQRIFVDEVKALMPRHRWPGYLKGAKYKEGLGIFVSPDRHLIRTKNYFLHLCAILGIED